MKLFIHLFQLARLLISQSVVQWSWRLSICHSW